MDGISLAKVEAHFVLLVTLSSNKGFSHAECCCYEPSKLDIKNCLELSMVITIIVAIGWLNPSILTPLFLHPLVAFDKASDALGEQ